MVRPRPPAGRSRASGWRLATLPGLSSWPRRECARAEFPVSIPVADDLKARPDASQTGCGWLATSRGVAGGYVAGRRETHAPVWLDVRSAPIVISERRRGTPDR